MGDFSQRSDLHSMRREQERERRRMRDRERRQSMTEEQRQMHLARRRKNYQLRRQKIKHLEVGYQSGLRDTASGSEIGERIEEQATPGASELSLNCNAIIPVGIDHVLQKINIEQAKSGGMCFNKYTHWSPGMHFCFLENFWLLIFPYTLSAISFIRH